MAAPSSDPVALARQHYAEELRHVAELRSPAVIAAFASVPRERFLGSGPWRIRRPTTVPGYWTTDDADPRRVYHNVLVALDEAREVNNGQPSLWAFLFEQLGIRSGERVRHLGCGTGYYTAVAAELAGPDGALTAVELDPGLATKAAEALTPWPQVRVLNEDGAKAAFEPVDLIIASAGATHPPASWLDGLAPGGRLLFPLTADRGPGAMLFVGHAPRPRGVRGALPVHGPVHRLPRRAGQRRQPQPAGRVPADWRRRRVGPIPAPASRETRWDLLAGR